MPRMRAADAAVKILELEGATQAFGLPGAAINPFYSAMRDHGGIKHVLARHVEGASHMAEGYTRAKAGNIGICIGTSGPAGTDMVTGLYSAMADSIPILAITGQAPVARLHKEVGIGERLGTKAFNALYGNRVEGVAPEKQDETATENLALAGKAAERIGAVVLVEPVSGAPAYPLKRAADAVAVIDRVQADHGVGSLRLLADLYHLAVNGDDVGAAIDSYAARIGHVQITTTRGAANPAPERLTSRAI